MNPTPKTNRLSQHWRKVHAQILAMTDAGLSAKEIAIDLGRPAQYVWQVQKIYGYRRACLSPERYKSVFGRAADPAR